MPARKRRTVPKVDELNVKASPLVVDVTGKELVHVPRRVYDPWMVDPEAFYSCCRHCQHQPTLHTTRCPKNCHWFKRSDDPRVRVTT